MGQAREIMDRITQAVLAGDRGVLRQQYADDAVGEAPEPGRLEGGDAIVEYMMSFRQAFPDLSWEPRATFEDGEDALDEGRLVGTDSGTLRSPDGDLPPTGQRLRLGECDVITVRGGRAVSHRFHYDRLDSASQLGLAESGTSTVPARAPVRTSRRRPRSPDARSRAVGCGDRRGDPVGRQRGETRAGRRSVS